jgi:anhydro-N-acetylmuramic acid kinase
MDIGPGNCMIDKWIRINSDKNFDENGNISKSGNIDKFILAQSLDNFYNNKISKKKSLDTNDFDVSFASGLSLENGAATITEFTADILSKKIIKNDVYVCGGGRKNKFLIEKIRKKIKNKIKNIDYLGIDGGFIESQAFGYLAIRSFLRLPISFPETTGCKKPSTGGVIVKNY